MPIPTTTMHRQRRSWRREDSRRFSCGRAAAHPPLPVADEPLPDGDAHLLTDTDQPFVHAIATAILLDERCGYRWSDGRPCADGTPHTCTRQGEHGTHVCDCLASDTPSRVVTV
jgi:hypothetical protein